MFQALFRRAQWTVDNAIGSAMNKLVISAPFLIAASFATAALYSYLVELYGSRTSQLMLAAGFSVIGLILAIALQPPSAQVRTTDPHETGANPPSDAMERNSGDQSAAMEADLDKDMASAAIAAAVPVALPVILRFTLRNLPMLLALFSVAVLALQSTAASQSATDEGGTSSTPTT